MSRTPPLYRNMLDKLHPWAVVNTAGYVRVDQAEEDADRCRRENSDGPAVLAEGCARLGIPYLTFSSDLVFDGSKSEPYVEPDALSPLNVYGQTKADGEVRVLAAYPSALVIRTSAFFGPWDEYNFVAAVLKAVEGGERFPAACDVSISPTYVPDLVNTSLDLMIDGEQGIWHLANVGSVTWADFALQVLKQAGLDTGLIDPRPASEFGWLARRPAYSVLGSERGVLLPPIDRAIDHCLSLKRAA